MLRYLFIFRAISAEQAFLSMSGASTMAVAMPIHFRGLQPWSGPSCSGKVGQLASSLCQHIAFAFVSCLLFSPCGPSMLRYLFIFRAIIAQRVFLSMPGD